MTPRLIPRLIILAGVAGALSLGIREIPNAFAQSGPPQINTVNVYQISSQTATVSYTADQNVTFQVVYDTASHTDISAYQFSTGFNTSAVASNASQLTGLKAGTTYHFRVQVKNAGGLTAESADRTFTTAATSGGGAGTTLVVTDIRADCTATQCRIAYSTNINATVEIRWDSSAHTIFGDYPSSTRESGAQSGLRSLPVPPANSAQLQASHTYDYRIQATTTAAGSFTTNNLTFQTSASNSDHTFSTGKCSDGTDIGQCNANRQLCDNGATLVTDCQSICAPVCPSGSTCNTSGQCIGDPTIDPNSPYQCNPGSCYTAAGQLQNPAPAGCFGSWPRCNANTILKVRKDRGCNLWLTCETSLQTEPSTVAPAENLCLSLAACNSLGKEGQCNKYLPQGQCSNDPLRFCSVDTDCQAGGTCNTPPSGNPTQSLQNLTFQTPEDVSKIADLSGNVVAGLDWHQQNGTNVIQGYLPWQLMRQVGGDAQLKNGDFEYTAPPTVTPWTAAPPTDPGSTALSVSFEDQASGAAQIGQNPNHVLVVKPTTSEMRCSNNTAKTCTVNTQSTDCGTGTCQATPIDFSGAASGSFPASPSEYYYAEARIKSASGTPTIRLQFGYGGYQNFSVTDNVKVCSNNTNLACSIDSDCGGNNTCSKTKTVTTNTYVDVKVTNAWQRVTLGPIKGMSGETRVAAVCADSTNCSEFWLDDVQVRPVLQIDTNPTYVTPSCRLYPKDDSPSCDYVDENNVIYKGWRGYCLEHDSQTGTCLSWWPVDIIKGQTNVFGAETPAGYQDRAPLYLCAESNGKQGGGIPDTFNSTGHCDAYSVGFGICHNNPTRHCDFGNDSTCTYARETENAIHNYKYFPMYFNPPGETCDGKDFLIAPNTITSSAASWQCRSSRRQIRWSQLGDDQNLRESDIRAVYWQEEQSCILGVNNGGCVDAQGDARFVNNQQFQDTTSGGVLTFYTANNDPNKPYHVRRTTDILDYAPGVQDNEGLGIDDDPPINPNHDIVWDLSDLGCNASSGLSTCEAHLAIIFDKNTHQLKEYVMRGWSNISGREYGPAYSVHFQLQDMCTKLVEVVDPNGNNRAFASRVQATSNYKVPDLNYTFTTDLAPFGGIRMPQGGLTPNAWTTPLYAEQPDFTQFPSTGQARSGSPYGCKGLCSDVICSADGSSCLTNGAIDTSKVQKCQEKNTGLDNVPPGECIGVTAGTPATAKDVQFFQDTHDAADVNNLGGTPNSRPFYSEDHIRRLFTQTYGVWSTQRCTNDPNRACQSSTDCPGNPAGVCQSAPLGPFALITNSIPGSPSFVGWTSPTTICPTDSSQPNPTPKRPPYPNDYCAIPPSVSNAAFLNSQAKLTTINSGSGSVGIKFNSLADGEQIPLSTIAIDWGDEIVSQPFPYAPRNDPSKPHIFAHAYVLNRSTNAQGCSRDSTGQYVCTYHIKIQVQDNWGWCNDNAGGNHNCPPTSANWYDTGLTVKVTP